MRPRASTAARYAAVVDMRTTVASLVEEAEEQIRDRVWQPLAEERALAAQAASELSTAVTAPDVQQALEPIDRLERLREALAVLAVALARVHGRMAWFLAAASTALIPVLHWRALPAEGGRTFGAVEPTAEQYADAEDAVRGIRDTLLHVASV